MAREASKIVRIFLGSPNEDTVNLRDRLWKHLATIRNGPDVDLYPHEITPGRNRTSEINKYLNTSDIILLLISPNFIAYNGNIEVIRSLERYNAGEEIRIIPILLVPVDWEKTDLGAFQPLPKNRIPVKSWYDKDDEAFLDIAKGIGEAINDIHEKKAENECRKQGYVNRAKMHFQNGNYQEALDYYEPAIRIDRSDASLYEDKGDIQIVLKRFENALTSYETALRLTPESGPLWGKKGQALFNLDRYSEAEIAYQQAIRCTPDKADFFIRLGDTRLAPGRLKNAIASYERGCQLEPGNAQFHIKLGDAYLKSGNTRQAFASYERAYKLEPSNAQSCVKLGDVYLSLSSPIKAIDYYEQAIRLQPQDAKIHRSKARAQFAFAKLSSTNRAYYKMALETYRIALTLDANDPDSYKEVGDIFLHLWQLDNALDAYEQAIRLKTDFSQAYRCQGEVFDKKASEARKKADEIERRNNK